MSRPSRLWLIFGSAFVVRTILAFVVVDPLTLFRVYDNAALNLVAGRGLVTPMMGQPDVLIPLVMYPPGYSLFLAPFHLLFGEALIPIRIAHILLGAAGALFLALAAEHALRNRIAGLAAGLALALLPVFAVHDVVLSHATSLPNFFLVLAFWLWFTPTLESDRARFLLIGSAMGLATLVRSEHLVVALAFFLSAWIVPRGTRLKIVALFLLGITMALGPATARNYVVFGELRPTPPGTGLILLQTVGKYSPPELPGFGFHEREVLEAEGGEYTDIYWPNPYERDARRVDRVKRFALERPLEYITILARNLPAAWFGHRLHLSDDKLSVQKLVARGDYEGLLDSGWALLDRALGLACALLVFATAIVGLLKTRRQELLRLAPFWFAAGLLLLAFVPLGALGRYTIPAYIAMLPLSGAALARYIGRRAQAR